MADVNLKREAKWAEAQKLCGLNDETVRMGKELGLNPLSMIQKIPTRKTPGKPPIHVWIREMYAERQAKVGKVEESKATVDEQDGV